MTISTETPHSALSYFGTREELARRWVATLQALLNETQVSEEALCARTYPPLNIETLRAVRAGDASRMSAHLFRRVCFALGLSAEEYFPRKSTKLSSDENRYWSERLAADDSMMLIAGTGRPDGHALPSNLSVDLYLYLLACREFDEGLV